MNAKRKLGIWLLATPFALTVLLFVLILTRLEIAILAIPLMAIGFFIWGIVYAIKRHVKIALIPLLLLVFIFLPMGGAILIPQFSAYRMKSMESSRIGLSTGGAKDISNFRKNIENNYLPLPTDITYEGLFFEYFFHTGETTVCEKLFCPSYSYAISKDPFSQEEEYYLQVGLNSGMKESDFSRKKLNLVIVLDVSGSMGSPFNRYYYDQFGRRQFSEEEPDNDAGKSKMEIASIAVLGLLDHLFDGDRLGMVLFDHRAYLAKPLNDVGDTDMNAIKGHIMELAPRGGTRMSAGMKEGTELFDEFLDANQDEYENRIIFLTDAMPNLGDTSEEGLFGITESNSENKIYTTFIGIGVDFNTELVDAITKIRGANYYSVHSAKEFKTRMDDEFEYLVTPLVFNLLLQLDAEGFEIEKVYGSPEANEATGEIMKVNTLFPSKKEGDKIKGGIVILKLKKISEDAHLRLKTSYEDRGGQMDGNDVAVTLPQLKSDHYDNSGIRKGVLLSRYVNVMRNWIDDERKSHQESKPIKPSITFEKGIFIPPDVKIPQLGRWERQSIPLRVSKEYKGLLMEFKRYFDSEKEQLQDETLAKESEILEKLIIYK